MKYYKQASKVRNGASTSEVGLTKTGEIIVGKFVDRDRPDYRELMVHQFQQSLGDEYAETGELACN